MTDAPLATGDSRWKTIGYLNDCQECITLGFDGVLDSPVVVASARPARYAWWERGSSSWCPVRLCVECCAQWRAQVEAGKRPVPLRISEIEPTIVAIGPIGQSR